MTNQECEQEIFKRLMEIVTIYKQFNSDGDYLDLVFIEKPDGISYMFNNASKSSDDKHISFFRRVEK